MYHTVFHSFSLFPNCLRFLDNLCIIDPIRFEHLDVIKTDQSESVNFASFIGSEKKKCKFQISRFLIGQFLGTWFFFFKKHFFFLTLFMFFHIFLLPSFTPSSPLHPSTLASWSWHLIIIIIIIIIIILIGSWIMIIIIITLLTCQVK